MDKIEVKYAMYLLDILTSDIETVIDTRAMSFEEFKKEIDINT